MDELRLPTVAARVVDWHNRHPLARRIGAAQVHGIGYVALPFAVAAPDVPAAALPTTASLKPDFSADFIDPLRPHQVARFAALHGRVLAEPPADGTLRQVPADGRHAGDAAATIYVLTAVVETATRKSRVLIGAGAQPAVLGRRIYGTARAAAVAAALALVAGGLHLAMQPADEPAPALRALASAAPASAVAGAATSASAAAGAGSANESVAAVAPADVAASAAAATVPASAAQAAVAAAGTSAVAQRPAAPPPARQASAPLATTVRLNTVVPALGRIAMPSIRPQLSDVARAAARQQSASARAAPPQVPASGPAYARAAAPVTAPVVSGAAAAALPEVRRPAAAFALSTRALRTRAEADQVRVAMFSLLRTGAAEEIKVDVLPQGDDWRVVGWSFPRRTDADKARALLVSRGMRVEVVDF